MATEIYELCKRTRASDVVCHCVAGRHEPRPSGRRYQVRKVRRNALKQYKSWFEPAPVGWPTHQGHRVVAQVYFPFGDRSIDDWSDRKALDSLTAHYRFALRQHGKVALTFVGNTDARGGASFNKALGQQRAEAVRRYVDRAMIRDAAEELRFPQYRSRVTSLGESKASGDHAGDRRVDVVLTSGRLRKPVESHVFDELIVTADYKGPLTRNLLFRFWGALGAGKGVSFDVLEIEIKNPRTARRAFYTYRGLGGGVSPISGAGPQEKYWEKEVPFSAMVDVDDFEGPGGVGSSNMLIGGATVLVFRGPRLEQSKKLLKTDGLEFQFSEWGLGVPNLGVTVGTWRRMPYRSESERRAHMDAGREHFDRDRRLPKKPY